MKQLSENILDIAENSVKAKATLIGIDIKEDGAAGTLTITISDDGCGMDAQTVARVTDPFYTTRTTRKVGLGIPFFKMEAEMTGGSFSLASEPGKGTVISATFVTGHIDSIPLGDVAQTLMILIGGSPDVDFTFSHTRDGEAISLDTREMKEVLGEGVSLAEPEVMLWLREYVAEQYAGFNKDTQ